MNTIKRFVYCLSDVRGVKKFLLLFAAALLFSLPFVTKSLFSDSFVENMGLGVFGWIGLVPLFLNVFDFEKTLKRVLCSLFCFFWLFYFFVYSWFINLYPLDFAGLGNLESMGVIVIAETVIPLLHGFLMTFCVFIGYVAARGVKNNYLRAVLVSFGYVLGEYVQSLGTFAFPWARLFVGQTENVYLLQSASLFGSYFITFVMVLVNALAAFSLMNPRKSGEKRRMYAFVAAGVFALNALFGVVHVNTFDCTKCKSLNAVVLQGNIPSGQKWSGEVDEKEVYLNLADWAKSYRMAKDFDADIAVMPETAFPTTIYPYDGYDSPSEEVLMQISKRLDAFLFAGAFNKQDGNSYNSIFAYDSDGCIAEPYNKYNIVPFGEFLPYRSILEKVVPSLAEINMLSSDLARGNTFTPTETPAGSAACLVCFDSIFPETARRQIKNGGEFIVISTNDSWYKTSSAIYQHADHAVMRAIENNVPVIRSANTGISRIIDNFGRVREETKVNERTAISASVFLPDSSTLYTKIGDVFVLLCTVGIVTALLVGISKKKASH